MKVQTRWILAPQCGPVSPYLDRALSALPIFRSREAAEAELEELVDEMGEEAGGVAVLTCRFDGDWAEAEIAEAISECRVDAYLDAEMGHGEKGAMH